MPISTTAPRGLSSSARTCSLIRRLEEVPILELIVFTTGGVLLALEIVASRVVAPYFGNSIYVWGSLISVFLAALSFGYYAGGRMATRWPSVNPFLALVLLGGLTIFPIPHVADPLLSAITRHDYGPRANPLLGSTILFFLPCVLLGATSPYAVRLRARTVENVGNVAGILYALSTLGSILGTLLAAFVLISAFGVRTIIHVLGTVEIGLALLGYAWNRQARLTAGILPVVAFLLITTAGVAPDDPNVVFAQDTIYHRITVTDEGDIRYLKLDHYWQSGLDRSAPLRTVFTYTDYLHLPMIFHPRPARILFVGMGGGIAPSRFYHDYPLTQIDVVELDPAVVRVARRYFNLPTGDRLRVHAQDGRLWIRRANMKYGVIVLDAYLIDAIPFHLATREFYDEVKAHLSPSGAMASNVIGTLHGPQSRLFRSIYKTLRAVFPAVYVFPVGGDAGSTPQNIILVGTMEPRLSRSEILKRAASLERRGEVRIPGFAWDAATLVTEPIPTTDVPVLTDDYAPTDLLVSPHR